MTEFTTGLSNPQITPHLEIWEWQIPAYLFLGGLVAGLMILNGLWRLTKPDSEGLAITRTGAVAAPLLLSLGMVFLFLDLEYKLHVYKFYLTFKPLSPMSWGSWILLLVYPVQILSLALNGGVERLGSPLKSLDSLWQRVRRFAVNYEKALAWLSIAFGALLGLYTGVLLSANAARPLWNTSLLAPLFLVSGMSAAAACVLLSRPTHAVRSFITRWDVGLLIGETVTLGLILVSFFFGAASNQDAARLFFGGPFTASFWTFVVILGLALPLWLELRELLHRPVPLWLGPVFVLCGGLALRFVLVSAGQMSSLAESGMLSLTVH